MVFSTAEGDYMETTGRDRPKTRHNFTLRDLKWGVQRSLRCMKVQSHDNRNRRSEERIEEFGEKIVSDLITEAEKMKESIFREQRERDVSPSEAPGVAAEVKPWNLRKRRAACNAPVKESVNCDDGAKTKFMSTLTKKEMEDDYVAMMGHRPPRRPKKRLRTLQKQIDLLHPAFYFTEVTEGIYEVPDPAETRKR